jgi:hypothetical protein
MAGLRDGATRKRRNAHQRMDEASTSMYAAMYDDAAIAAGKKYVPTISYASWKANELAAQERRSKYARK